MAQGKFKGRGVVASAVLGVSSLAGAAHAQDAQEVQARSDEIVVTAQRRAESLTDVPLSVSAFDQEAVETRGVTDFTQLASSVPSMQFEEVQSQRNARIVIRGISADTRFPGSESAVGVIVDGVNLSGVSGLAFDLADIERVEVLRGPQGTLYGRNTAAGVVNIFTTAPGDDFEAGVTAEFGNYDHVLARGYVRGPLIEGTLSASLSFIAANRDGFETMSNTGEDVNNRDTIGARAQLRWTPTAQWVVRLIGEYLEDEMALQRGQDDALEPVDRRLDNVVYRPDADREIWGVALTAERSFTSGLNFRSITSRRWYETNEADSNFAVAGMSFVDRLNTEESNEFTQEFQLRSGDEGRLDWVVGAFFLDQQLDFDGAYDVNIDGIYATLFGPSAAFFFGAPGDLAGDATFFGGTCALVAPACEGVVPALVQWDFDTQSAALFGQLGLDLTDRLKLTLGARASWEERDFRYYSAENAAIPALPGFLPNGVVFIAGQGNPDFGAPLPYADSIEEENTTARISITYALNDDNNIYVSVAQGSKAGNFYGNVLGVSDANSNGTNDFVEFLEIAPESSWNYEIGAKGRIGPVRYAAAAYFIDYTDLQTQRVLPLGVSSIQVLGNADAEIYGAELELSASLTEALSLTLALGYNQSEFTDYANCAVAGAVFVDCTGNELVYAPETTAALGLDYRQPIGGDLEVTAWIGANYRGEQFYDVTNDPDLRGDDVTLLDAAFGLGRQDRLWNVALWGRNLTDEDYAAFLAPDLVGTNTTLGAPRTYGVRLSARY